MPSRVFYKHVNSNDQSDRNTALKHLLCMCKPFTGLKPKEIVPVKVTIGDLNCVFHIKPETLKIILSEIQKSTARPFVFDTNVIYKGSRTNAVDHLNLAEKKGFSSSEIGAPFIIADGLFGNDGIETAIDGSFIKKAKLPSFIGMLDSLVVVSHVTGHILSGYAGAIKNVAMGMTSKATKQVQHSSVRPTIKTASCVCCEICVSICPANAITIKQKKAVINKTECIGCGECLCACKFNAVNVNWAEDPVIFCNKMVEVTSHILSRFKHVTFINFVYDISKECDCISNSMEKLICRDIGILASHDAVSIDKATIDLINKNDNVLANEHLNDAYIPMLEYAHKKEIGDINYELITL